MRPLLVLSLLMLTGCSASVAAVSRMDDGVFRIEGPQIASISDAAIKRAADRVCPKGFYVLGTESHKGGVARAAGSSDDMKEVTVWLVKCI